MTKRFHYLCRLSGCNGELIPLRNIVDESEVPVYLHKCTKCSNIKTLQNIYPRIVNDDLDEYKEKYI